MATHLVRRGHDVRLASYDRGYRNLKDDFDVLEIEGLTIASSDNKVLKVRTFTENLRRLPAGYHKLQELRDALFGEFRPDVAITDFEPMTAYLSDFNDIPLITLDNQHRMRYMEIDYPEDLESEAKMTRTIIRAMVPRPDVSLATTFHFGRVLNDRTFLFPPILREAVRGRQPGQGDHVVVYLTSGFETLLEELRGFPAQSFRVYGYDRSDQDGNLRYRPFDREGFLDDLATSKAVVATAGFTLIGEALYLRKPYLALPMTGQFEQQVNGHALERLGYGMNVRSFEGKALAEFLDRIPEFSRALAAYAAADNRAIESKLDELFADDVALAREFHRRRRL